jgi:hypothetical protein
MKDIYDYLNEYGFSTVKRTKRGLMTLRRDDIEAFLEGYAELTKKALQIKRCTTGSLDLFPDSWGDPLPLPIIRQLSLYANAMYIHDPILDYLYDLRALDLNPNYVMQCPDPHQRLSKLVERLIATIEQVWQIRPLVREGILKLVPTQLISGRKDPRAIYSDSFYGPGGSMDELAGRSAPIERLPKAIRNYADSMLYVYPAQVVENRPEICYGNQLTPTRMIGVGFPGDPWPKLFTLFEVKILDEETRTVGLSLNYEGGGQPVDLATFENWVRGSKNDVLLDRIETLQRDLYLAAFTGARFLTNLPTSRDLARLNLGASISGAPQEETGIHTLLQTSLPYFGRVTEKQIVKARANEAAFYEFRLALGTALKEIGCQGRQLDQAEIDEVVRDVLLGPLSKVETRMKALRRNIFIDAIMLAGTLVATFLSGGNTLTAAAGLLVAKETIADYKAQKAEKDRVKESPGFFYWDVTRKARSQERRRRRKVS